MSCKKAYYFLFNRMTDAVEKIKRAQIRTEEIYIHAEDDKPQPSSSDQKK